MEEALKDSDYAVIADLDAAEVLQPGIGALDFPTFAIASQLTLVFKAPVADVAAVRSDQLCAALFEPQAQCVRVVAAVGDDPPQAAAGPSPTPTWHSHRVECAFRQPVFGDLRGRKLRSDRYAAAVDHHHALRTLPATRLADRCAPFFAVTKVASRNASSQSNSLRSSNCPSSFRHACNHTPCSSQLLSRRQQVDPSGYSSGRSRHLAPVRSTHRMPSRHLRLDAHGRPRPSRRRLGSGNNGANTDHCASLNNARPFFIEEAQHRTCLTHKSLP